MVTAGSAPEILAKEQSCTFLYMKNMFNSHFPILFFPSAKLAGETIRIIQIFICGGMILTYCYHLSNLSINNCSLKITDFFFKYWKKLNTGHLRHSEKSQQTLLDTIINYRRCPVYTGHLATLLTKHAISLIRSLSLSFSLLQKLSLIHCTTF